MSGRAAVVSEARISSSGVGLVFVQVGGQNISWAIKLSAGGLVVTGKNHVWHLGGDVVEPLLPEIPVGFVDDAHVTTLWTTLVGDFSRGQRHLVVVRDGSRAWEGRVGAIVADRPGIVASQLARENAGVPIISIRDITAVPGKGDTIFIVNCLDQLLPGTLSVGVTHVVEDRNGEWLLVTSLAGSGEAQDIGGGGAIGGGDLIVVGGIFLQSRDLDFVEELRALGDHDLGARWRTVITLNRDIELAHCSRNFKNPTSATFYRVAFCMICWNSNFYLSFCSLLRLFKLCGHREEGKSKAHAEMVILTCGWCPWRGWPGWRGWFPS